MSIKNRILLIFLFIILSLIISVTAFYYYPFFNSEKFYAEQYDKGFVVKSNQEEFKTYGDVSIKDVYKKAYNRVEYNLCDPNPFNLKFCVFLVTDESYVTLNIFKIKRNFFGIEFTDYRTVFFEKGLTLDSSVEMVKKYDFFDENVKVEKVEVRLPVVRAPSTDRAATPEQAQNNLRKKFNEMSIDQKISALESELNGLSPEKASSSEFQIYFDMLKKLKKGENVNFDVK